MRILLSFFVIFFSFKSLKWHQFVSPIESNFRYTIRINYSFRIISRSDEESFSETKIRLEDDEGYEDDGQGKICVGQFVMCCVLQIFFFVSL